MVFDKLKFWKKNDVDLSDLDGTNALQDQPDPLAQDFSEQGQGFSQQNQGQQDFSQPQSGMTPEQYPPTTPFPGQQEHREERSSPRDMELILAKLDMIKSELDSLHQRVRNIEQATEKKQSRYW